MFVKGVAVESLPASIGSTSAVAAMDRAPGVPLSAVDWRFLLPAPRSGRFDHLLLLGGPPGLAERVIDLGVARQVTCEPDGGRTADAVVVLHEAHVTVSSIARRVRPGGVLYLEIDRHSAEREASTPRRLYRALRDAGFHPIHSYAVWPGFTEQRTYLPVERPAAFRWYASTLRSSSTLRSTILEASLKVLLASAGQHVTTLAPALAVIAIMGRPHRLSSAILGNPGVAAVMAADDLRPVLLTRGGDRVVLLPFGRGDRLPAGVLKVPRLAAFNDRTANEQHMLSFMARTLKAHLRESVPEPLGLFQHRDVNVAVESYRRGLPLSRSIRRWGRSVAAKASDLQAAASWLADFHREAEVSRSPWSVAEMERWVEEPIKAYRRVVGITEREERLFRRASCYGASLAGASFPVVWQHRDFKPNHVFRSGGRIAVIDWEGGRPGPPLCDLLHFLVHWHGAVRGIPAFPGLARLFFGSHPPDAVSGAVSGALQHYLAVLQLDPRFVPLLILYTCLELVLRRAEQQRLQGDGGRQPRAGNQNVELVDVLTRHSLQLFPDDQHMRGI